MTHPAGTIRFIGLLWGMALVILPLLSLTGCAQVEVPGARTVSIPPAQQAEERMKTINEARKPVTRVPLQEDVLVPKPQDGEPLPDVFVGPFELRSETLAGALQLILSDFDISLAFETQEGLSRRITIANLRGMLPSVVEQVCGLADLYCSYENGLLTIKERETFIVDLPPLGTTSSTSEEDDDSSSSSSDSDSSDSSELLTNIANGVQAITGGSVTLDETTRTLIYDATHRSSKRLEQYFAKLRKNTALIVYEIHVWEVALTNENNTGIDWSGMLDLDNFTFNYALPGGAPAVSGGATPISITPSYTGSANLTASGVLDFISTFGAVKTVSQPQLTVLSGSEATLSVVRSEAYVSQVSEEQDETTGNTTSSVTTGTVDDGLTMTISSAWDHATVYGVLDIQLNQLLEIRDFPAGATATIQQPITQTRSLQTQIRVRPGDAILIAGVVTERDNYSGSGPGLLKPWFDTARQTSVQNNELVFLLRPRVVVYVDPKEMESAGYKLLSDIGGTQDMLAPQTVSQPSGQVATSSDTLPTLPEIMPMAPENPGNPENPFDGEKIELPESLNKDEFAPEPILEPPPAPKNREDL